MIIIKMCVPTLRVIRAQMSVNAKVKRLKDINAGKEKRFGNRSSPPKNNNKQPKQVS